MRKQYIEDLQEEVRNRQEGCLGKLGFFEFENIMEIMIAAREGSSDPRRQIARRFLDWYDFINGTAYRCCEEINATLDEDLKDFPHYRDMIPDVPPEDTFHEEHWADERFDNKVTDTLDINGGQDDLGEDPEPHPRQGATAWASGGARRDREAAGHEAGCMHLIH